METTILFEKKVSIGPKDINEVKTKSIDEMILQRAKDMVENKCSENGFVLPGSVTIISRSMGYYEAARFTGDVNYYVKLQGTVLYPVDGARLTGRVIRKNKMGLYVNYKDSIHIQVPRDLHVGNPKYEEVQIDDMILVELKRSKFAINDPFILSSGQFIAKEGEDIPASDINVIRNKYGEKITTEDENDDENDDEDNESVYESEDESEDESEESEDESESEEESPVVPQAVVPQPTSASASKKKPSVIMTRDPSAKK